MRKWNNIKQKNILLEKISVDYNTTDNLDIKRKAMQEDSKFVDFAKNLKNVTDDRQYRKRKTRLYSDVVKSVDSSTKEASESSKMLT